MDLESFLAEWNNDSPTVLVHTSGSTGTPKPMQVEKQRMEASARITCSFLGLRAGDTALLCMPLDYIAGKMMVVRALTCNLRLSCVLPSGHPLSDFTEPVDFAAMVPLQVYNSLQVAAERERLRQIRHLIIGGGAIDESLQRYDGLTDQHQPTGIHLLMAFACRRPQKVVWSLMPLQFMRVLWSPMIW